MIALLSSGSLIAVSNPETFLQNLYEEKNQPCSTCISEPLTQEHERGKNLMIFMSFSVPLESWKDLSDQLEQTEGFFVLKGIPGDSFEEFSEKISSLKVAGVNAPINIDPQRFEEYRIESVPTIVLEDEIRSDRVIGNIRLDAALREMAEKGDAGEKAREILRKLGSQA